MERFFQFQGIYCGVAPAPHELWARWNLDPLLLCALIALALIVRSKWSGRMAVAVLCIAFVSPLCALSSALFSARVVHHVLLVAVAAPMLALAWQSRAAAKQNSASPAFVLTTALLWWWHTPLAYDAALANTGLYWVMQLSLLGSFIWFWRKVFDHGLIESLGWVAASFAQMGLLGALITFSPQPLYAAHAAAPLLWGITPLSDQQLGGLIMWVPAGIPYGLAALLLMRDKGRLWLGDAA